MNFNQCTLYSADVNALYVSLLHHILEHGQRSAPRGLPIMELLGVSLRLTDPYHSVITIPTRGINYHFMAAEALWILLGRDDVAFLSAYNSRVAQFSDDGEKFWGAYGPRLVRQRRFILDTLTRDPDSRQAVIEVWREEPPRTKDVPCTLSWQFLLRNGKLNLIATMRSSDAWLGIPYDVYSFASVLRLMADCLGVNVGFLQLNLGSSHLYETNWDVATGLLLENEKRLSTVREYDRVPALPVWRYLDSQISLLEAEELVRTSNGKYGHQVLGEVTEPWKPYAETLAHRFLKDDERLRREGSHPFCEFLATKEW